MNNKNNNFYPFPKEELLKYSYKFNKSALEWYDFIKTDHCLKKPLTYKSYENSFVVSDAPLNTCFKGCVLDQHLKPIKLSYARYEDIDVKKLLANRDFDNAFYYEKEVIYLGQIRNHWGSFLLDTIGRLWYKIDDAEKNTYVISQTMPSVGTNLHNNIWRFFELLGIKRDQILIVDNVAKFKKIIIPELSFLLHKYYTKEYQNTFERIHELNTIPASHYKKIYFSRYSFSKTNKTDYGEERIINMMKANDFKIIYPESLDLIEIISLINGCETLITIGGALAHNIIFLSKKKEIKPTMFLFNRLGGYQWHQWLINESVGVPINYVDCYNEPYRFLYKTPVNGPFLFGINANVKRFAKVYNLILPKRNVFIDVKIFIRYSLRVFRTIGSKIKKRIKQ